MILDPLKHVQNFFEVDPSFGSKVMRLLVFAKKIRVGHFLTVYKIRGMGPPRFFDTAKKWGGVC